MHDVIIIGAGLSGLTTAFALSKEGIDYKIIEGRNRAGGRINSLDGPLEMGATWLGSQHTHLISLLKELDLEIFLQHTKGQIAYEVSSVQPIQYFDFPPGQTPSYRIKGGSSKLIQALIDELAPVSILYNAEVSSINHLDDLVEVCLTNGQVYTVRKVVVTIPPQLLERSVLFTPPLSAEKVSNMAQTHTWMGESIKYGVTYSSPFWKAKGLSGMGFSQVGVVQEVHDHTDFDQKFFALKGFLNAALSSKTLEERKAEVIKVLIRLFGPEANEYLDYHEHVWANDRLTSVSDPISVVPHQNNGNPLLREDAFNGKLIFSGTESSAEYPGYMDGAVYSGFDSAKKVLEQYQSSLES